jgi:hypothetical protein
LVFSVLCPLSSVLCFDPDDHLTVLGELDGIADQVQDHLPQPVRVADQAVRHVRGDVERQLQAFLVGALGHRLDGVGQRVAQRKLRRHQFQLTGLDFREVKDVVEDGEEGLGRGLDQTQVLALFGGEVRLQGELGHAEDAVHGRADFVAHIRQELALGLARRLRCLLGPLQFLFGVLPGGDVGVHAEDADDIASGPVQRHLAGQQDGLGAVRPVLRFFDVEQRPAGVRHLAVTLDEEVGLRARERQVVVGLADRIRRRRQAQVGGAAVVAAEVFPVPVLPEDGAGDVVDNVVEQGLLLLQRGLMGPQGGGALVHPPLDGRVHRLQLGALVSDRPHGAHPAEATEHEENVFEYHPRSVLKPAPGFGIDDAINRLRPHQAAHQVVDGDHGRCGDEHGPIAVERQEC